jgi:hypothetical protein
LGARSSRFRGESSSILLYSTCVMAGVLIVEDIVVALLDVAPAD